MFSARKFVQENPMKMYAFIFISADLLFATNVFVDASFLWVVGACFGLVTHFNKMMFGRGALPQLDADDYKIPLSAIGPELKKILIYNIQVFSAQYWGKIKGAIVSQDRIPLSIKLKRCIKFYLYPLDFGWLMIFLAGVMYTIDSVNIFGLRDEASYLQVIMSVQICMAAFLAFATDRNDLAGSLFASVTLWTLFVGVVQANIPFLLSSILFLYANYLIGKVDSKHQSDFTSKQFAG